MVGEILFIQRDVNLYHQDYLDKPVTAAEYWSRCQDGTVLSPFGLMGLASLDIKFTVVDQKIQLQIQLITEVGKVDLPSNFDFRADNVIVGSFWFPIRESQARVLQTLHHVFSAGDAPMSPGAFFQTYKALKDAGVLLTISGDISSTFAIGEFASSRLQAHPYDYQRIGISWLSQYFESSLGMILADEMGLGKTLQAIGLVDHILGTTEDPVLIVCPTTLLLNWEKEFKKFLPEVEPYLHWGAQRSPRIQRMLDRRVIITSYGLLINDIANLRQVNWGAVICDEAQKLKNRKTSSWRAVRELKPKSNLLVTGTPFENKLTDIWALIDIVNPGLLGPAGDFERQSLDSRIYAQHVSEVISPLIMRRYVKDVGHELPECIESEEFFPTPIGLAQAYAERLSRGDSTSPQESFLSLAGDLLQICASTELYGLSAFENSNPKVQRLVEISDELSAHDEDKIIIFSHWKKTIRGLVALLAGRYGASVVMELHGDIKKEDRQGIVDEFNSKPGFAILICNPVVAGVGLNITGANHVVHYSREWNPMVERQATARAWRRGQDKTVFVHKFVYENTIEQIVVDRMKGKEELSEIVLSQALNSEEAALQARVRLLSPLENQ